MSDKPEFIKTANRIASEKLAFANRVLGSASPAGELPPLPELWPACTTGGCPMTTVDRAKEYAQDYARTYAASLAAKLAEQEATLNRLFDNEYRAAAKLAEAERDRDAYKGECDTLRHQVITCGVAATHPDATLTTRGAYAGKWNSKQAGEVRALRERAERAEAKLAEAQALVGRWTVRYAEQKILVDEAVERAERAEAECATLRALLSDAADEVEAWGAYASEYFQDKHDLDGNVKRFRDAARRGETP